MAGELVYSSTQVVPIAIAATGPTAPFSLKQAEAYYAEVIVTTSAGAVDVALQHSTDLGITWQTLPLKFGQVAAAPGNTSLSFKTSIGIGDAAGVYSPALVGAAIAANIPANIRNMRAFVTLGTAGNAVISLRFTMLPKGSLSAL